MNLQNDLEPAGEQMTLFSLAGSRNYANPTQWPENDLEKKTNAIYGQKCLEQFERFNRVGSWAKTFSALLIGQTGWFSKRCKLTWKLKGTKYRRMFFQLRPSTLPTEGIGFGLLPTVTAMDCTNATATMKSTQVKEGSMHSVTLTRAMAMGMLPTPKVGGKEGYETRAKRQGHEKAISHLEAFVEYHIGTTSQQLNPQFVMEMMGFPPNWTLLPFLNGETNQSKQEVTQ